MTSFCVGIGSKTKPGQPVLRELPLGEGFKWRGSNEDGRTWWEEASRILRKWETKAHHVAFILCTPSVDGVAMPVICRGPWSIASPTDMLSAGKVPTGEILDGRLGERIPR